MSDKTKASDNNKPKSDVPPGKEAAPKVDSTKVEEASKSPETGAAPANYSRGEGQKPVTAAYKENWNAIFAKKKAKKKKR